MIAYAIIFTHEFNSRLNLKIRSTTKCWVKTLIVMLWIVELALMIPLAIALSMLVCSICIVPAFLYQTYKLHKVFTHWGSVLNEDNFVHVKDPPSGQEVSSLPVEQKAKEEMVIQIDEEV